MNYIQKVLRNNTPESSKRFFGGIGFVAAMLVICIVERQHIDLLLVTSSSMIGLETVTKIFEIKKRK